jgi:hypothetical protein
MPVQTKIQFRRSIATDWVAVNPILSAGEVGYETDSKKFKIGDGTTAWNSLAYAAILPSELNELVDDRVNDLLVPGSNIEKSYSDSTNALTISVTGVSLPGHTHTSSAITDFNSSVSGLLPVKSLVAGTNISVTPTGDKGFVISTDGLDTNAVKDVIGSTISGVSGVAVSYNNTSKIVTVSLSDPSIQSTDVTDFNTAVSGLVSGIYAPLNSPTFTGTVNGITKSMVGLGNVDNTSDTDKPISIATQSGLNLKASLAGAIFTGSVTIPSGTGNFNILTVNNTGVSLSGHSHISSNITDFNSSVSGLLDVKSLVQGTGIGIANNLGVQTISVTGIPSSLITDLGNVATTQVIGRTGVALSYDSVNDIMYIDTTGVSLIGHTHVWNNITDASTRATLNELAYLSGVSAGTASANRALVLDANKSITSINSITTTGNITVGGNLVVQGTTTTVNSTTVEIGDNIIRVNTSGLNTGGMEVYTGSDTKSLIWNTSSNRWELTGGNIYTSGSFIGSLSGNAATVSNGVYTTDTGTVTSTMIANDTIVNADINSSAAISYSKLNLSNSITNSDIASNAAIAVSKLASSGVTIGSTVVNLGSSTNIIAGLSSISGTSAASPTTLYYCVIDGGTP